PRARVRPRRPLRICHLGKYYPPAPGGMETHIRTLAQAQAALGVEAHVVCVNHADKEGRDLTTFRFRSTPTLREADGPVRVSRAGRKASLAKLDICPDLLALLRQFRSAGLDLLHLHTPNPTMLLALAVLRPAATLVITHHSDIVRQRFLRHVLGPVERFIYG